MYVAELRTNVSIYQQKITCKQIARNIIAMETNRTCQVTVANTERLAKAFVVAATLEIKLNAISISTILISTDTYIKRRKVSFTKSLTPKYNRKLYLRNLPDSIFFPKV